MAHADDQFEAVYRFAQTEPQIVGLFLTGSRGKGFHTSVSDYDVWVITADSPNTTLELSSLPLATDALDLGIMSLNAFRSYATYGSANDWERYSFAHVPVLLDKTGELQGLVQEKGSIPNEAQQPLIRGALDAYLNSIYRSAKCFRNGNLLGARLEASDSIAHGLCVMFAREGRHRPYYGYLERELHHYPLTSFPLDSHTLLSNLNLIAATGDLSTQQALLAIVDRECRADGYSAVFDGWGSDYAWMTTYRLTQP